MITFTSLHGGSPFVIAHRGASGYLPEHTLPAKVLAHGQGADFLEQDVVLTRDKIPIVLHDIHLDRVTDVQRLFPDRHRDDGRYYAIDFTWEEIQTLRVTERLNDQGRAFFPRRFPAHTGNFRISTLDEELIVIAGLNRSTGRTAGIYPEIKQPAFHRAEGQDISKIVLGILEKHGYRTAADRCFVQCFDTAETRRLREELKCQLALIQLLDGDQWLAANFNETQLRAELVHIADYANGVGPSMSHLFRRRLDGQSEISPLIPLAHSLNLQVHPWTMRRDEIPKAVDNWEDLHRMLYQQGIEAVFSDFPDLTIDRFRALAGR